MNNYFNELKEIEKHVSVLGTTIDTYLKEFYNVCMKIKYVPKNFDTWKNNSETYKNKSASTLKQVEKIYSALDIYNGNINDIIDSYDKYITRKMIKSFEILVSKKSSNDLEYKAILSILISSWIKVNSDKTDFSQKIGPRILSSKKYYTSKIVDYKMIEEYANKYMIIIFEKYGILSEYVNKMLNYDEKIIERPDEEVLKNYINHITIENEFITTNIKTIYDIVKNYSIKNGYHKITIPFYQREYVWTKEMINGVISELETNKSIMMNFGSLISATEKSKKVLVDGQQRLTTFVIFYNLIAKFIYSKNLNNENNFTSDELSFIDSIRKSNNILNNIENNSNENYSGELKEVMDANLDMLIKRTNSEKIMFNNAKVFFEFFNKLSNENIISVFKKSQTIVMIDIFDDKSDPIDLFISTNSSRVPLTNLDLIKALLISKVEGFDYDWNKRNELISKISNFKVNISKEKNQEKINDNYLNMFTNYYKIINDIDSPKGSTIFKTFTKAFEYQLSSKDGFIELFENMIEFIDLFRFIKNSNDFISDKYSNVILKDFIQNLGSSWVRSSVYDIFLIHFAKILSTQNNLLTEKIYIKLLNEFRTILLFLEKFDIEWKLFDFGGESIRPSIESIFIKFNIILTSNIENENFENLYIDFKNLIFENEDGFVANKMKEKFDKNDFIEKIRDRKDGNVIVSEILNRVSFNLYNSSSHEIKNPKNKFYNVSNASLEHIFPQKGDRWEKNDKQNYVDLIQTNSLESIGNKFLYNSKENSKASNKIFIDKLENNYANWNEVHDDKTLDFKYENEHFNFKELRKWTSKEVNLRENYILDVLFNSWNNI